MARRKSKTAQEREKRIIKECEFYLTEGQTIRSTAEEFGLSKSQIQADIYKLASIGRPDLQRKAEEKISSNWNMRQIKGGKNRWKRRRQKEVQENE